MQRPPEAAGESPREACWILTLKLTVVAAASRHFNHILWFKHNHSIYSDDKKRVVRPDLPSCETTTMQSHMKQVIMALGLSHTLKPLSN
jgi:hypothetical protein